MGRINEQPLSMAQLNLYKPPTKQYQGTRIQVPDTSIDGADASTLTARVLAGRS